MTLKDALKYMREEPEGRKFGRDLFWLLCAMTILKILTFESNVNVNRRPETKTPALMEEVAQGMLSEAKAFARLAPEEQKRKVEMERVRMEKLLKTTFPGVALIDKTVKKLGGPSVFPQRKRK